MRHDLFLSHSWSDKPFVRRLADDLHAAGYRVWLDERELRLGDPLATGISAGLENSERIAIVLSQKSVASPWVRHEVNAAIVREVERHKPPVLPLLIEDCEPPPLLAGRVYADFRTMAGYSDAFAKLIQALGPPTNGLPALNVEAARFIGSWSGGWQGSATRRDVLFRVVRGPDQLSGSMQITYMRNRRPNVVEESGVVCVNGTTFRMECTDHRWISRTTGGDWRHDRFQGALSNDGASLGGRLSDDRGRRAEFVFHREAGPRE